MKQNRSILFLQLQAGANLVVLNLSQQTDSSDLLGGFRPVEARDALGPLLPAFNDLVSKSHTFGSKSLMYVFTRAHAP